MKILSLVTGIGTVFFKKCESYDYEREIRALFNLDYEDKKGFNFRKYIENDGIYIHIEPKELIEKIYVCPLAPDWVLDVVKSIAGKYEIGEEKVFRSDLVTGEFK